MKKKTITRLRILVFIKTYRNFQLKLYNYDILRNYNTEFPKIIFNNFEHDCTLSLNSNLEIYSMVVSFI